MTNRSWLFVPGDNPKKIEKAIGVGADALILDLEDGVAPARRAKARHIIADALAARTSAGPALWVRINQLGSSDFAADFETLSQCAPDGVVLPKAETAGDVVQLAKRWGAPVQILPIAETPLSLFRLDSYAAPLDSLAGLTWGAEDLSSAVGAVAARFPDGEDTPLCALMRTLILAAAAAAGVPAIDTVFRDFRDIDALATRAKRSRYEGFTGMLAIHPAQVEVINAAFTPSAEEIEHAERIIALFESNPSAGALALDGKMIDAPHLKHAQRVLAFRARASAR